MTNRGDGHDENSELLEKKDNVVHLKVPRKSKSAPVKKPQQSVSVSSKWSKIGDETVQQNNSQHIDAKPKEAFLNLPHFTKYLLFTILSIHIVVGILLDTNYVNWVYMNLGFIPGRFTGDVPFESLALITPLTHIFLHGGWLHIAMNGIMLLAFGAGVEKWLGGKMMLKLFVFSALFGLIFHFALNYNSHHPMIGASGGLSGLFAVALIMLRRQNALPMGKYGFLPLIFLWVSISVLFGSMGGLDGSQIAWAAHVGGFLGGFILVKWMKI